MADKNVIVVSADPKGHFSESYAISGSGTFVPGQLMEIDQTAPLKNGRPQYKKWTTGGAEYVVVREDPLGGVPGDGANNPTYADGSWFYFYIPVPGDEIQLLCTDTEVNVGAPLAIQTGGSVTESTGAPSEFVALKALATISNLTTAAAGRLVLARVAGGVSGTPETTTTTAAPTTTTGA